MPCSRIEAPLAQCAPRLIGESNTGSCLVQTPFSTTASIAQPTEQCVQTVRLISTLPPASFFASAVPIMLYGSCAAAAAAPAVTPERLRKVRRSMVFARPACNPLARRGSAAALADFLVSSMATSSDLRGAVVVAYVLAGLVAARRTLFIFPLGIRTRILCHEGRRRGGAAGAYGQQEIATGEALGALGHDCLLDLIVLAAKYAPILEHFKCGKLKLEEAFCEAGDRLVEMGYLRLRYCIAQWPRCRLDPATEKPLLVRKFRLLLRNKMPHRLAQRRDVVLGLARPAAAAEAQRGQVGAQLGKRRLIRVTDGIGAGIKCNRRLAGADEGRFVLFAHCVRVGAGRRAGEFAPRGRDAALLRIDRVRPGDRLQERRVRGRMEQPRQQPVEVGPGRLLRVHFLKSKIVASERFCIMSTTRQSPHICRRRRAPSPANIEWPPSLPSMLSTIWRVPNGLPQRTQWNGSASFRVTASFAWGPKRSRGSSWIASSGQVSAHRPHCTQLRSMKRSRGASAASSSAPSGQAPMQALHSVQVCLLTARAPNGAPAGSLISSIFLGAFTAR